MKSLQSILKSTFGYDSFRSQQREIIETIVALKDTLVLMPTGGGKSLCFQIPAIYFNKTALVLSPLISLMKDQVESLKANGIKAAFINSSLTESEKNEILQQVRQQELTLLYISPETLIAGMNTWISQLDLSMVAIDEAHCVSMWGHDFRPEYTMIKQFRESLPHVPFIALTATADKTTRKDIIVNLGLKNPSVFISSFDRPNLKLDVRGNLPKKEKVQEIVEFIQSHRNQSGIIYCLSRKETEDWAAILNQHGIQASYYHAGMSADERSSIQHQFIHDEMQIICATIAFGMGIDKSNVRWVIHTNLPKNLESYYQEIGRAGRDGLPSETRLYYNYRDIVLLSDFIEEGEKKELLQEKLNRMIQYAESNTCRRRILLSYFGEHVPDNCGNCDVCLNPPAYVDGTEFAQKALSALKRTHEKITQNTLIEIVRGSKTSHVFKNNYHLIKTYGTGASLSFKEWQHLVVEFKNRGLLEVAYDENMHLKITKAGEDVLFGRSEIQVATYIEAEKKTSKKRESKVLRDEIEPLTSQEQLFTKLKLLRRKLAVAFNIPPYIVFNDATLHEMSVKQPTSRQEMLEISGVGEQKLAQFGSEFSTLIQTHIDEHQPKKSTYEQTLILVEEGKSLDEIAQQRNMQLTTIYSHLAKLYSDGYPIDIQLYVTPLELEKIKHAISITEHNNQLKPIYETLEGSVDYGKIRLVLAMSEGLGV
jgi:ATP-dependent DNA helicase RecQ